MSTIAGHICPNCGAFVPLNTVHQCVTPAPLAVPSVFGWPQVPKGCICPPGANATCEAPDCPRKPLRATAAGVTRDKSSYHA